MNPTLVLSRLTLSRDSITGKGDVMELVYQLADVYLKYGSEPKFTAECIEFEETYVSACDYVKITCILERLNRL